MNRWNRRKFLQRSGGLLAGSLLFQNFTSLAAGNSQSIPGDYRITDFGASPDLADNTLFIQEAINKCAVMGGGRVIIPTGDFKTGGISLRSHVHLVLEDGAKITGIPDMNLYPVSQVRWEGKWIQGRTALIFGEGLTDTGMRGKGSIIGAKELGGRPSAANPLRHPALIEFIDCSQLELHDFSTEYANMWSIHPTYCSGVHISGLTIRSTGGNGDGIDIDSCEDVSIDGCDISTGDDCISLKSGRGMEGFKLARPTKHVRISNCTFADSIFACIGIGSETSGGISDVTVRDCKFTHAKTFAVYIKTRPGRGAYIHDLSFKGLDVQGTEGGFLRFNLSGSGLQDQQPVEGPEGVPDVYNISFEDVTVRDVPILVDGSATNADKPVRGFRLKRVKGTWKKGVVLEYFDKPKIKDVEGL